jgi:excinuclease UvrABC helicase subunit UvrB
MISILVSYQYEIYRTTVRENCSVFSVKYDIVFVLPNTNSNSVIRIEIPPFDSA